MLKTPVLPEAKLGFLDSLIRYPNGYRISLAEDEGFEPPQTESESGVLPLHKSSIWWRQQDSNL